MNSITVRVWALLTGVFCIGVFGAGGLLYGMDRLRAEVRREHVEHEQIESYLELSAQIHGLFDEYHRIRGDGRTGAADLRDFRHGINEVILTLRGEIERERLEVEGPDGDGTVETEDEALVALVADIEDTLSAVETASAMFAAGRDVEAAALLSNALDVGITERLDPLIEQAVSNDAAEAEQAARTLRMVMDRTETGVFVFIGLIAAIATGGAVLVARTLSRSVGALEGEMERVALGQKAAAVPSGTQDEFLRLHAALGRVSDARDDALAENRELERALERRTEVMRDEHKDLRMQDQVRRDFLADVSHELRTPLTVLRGVAEVSLRTKSAEPEQLKAAMTRIVDEANHVGRIVNDLFFIARSQAGSLDLRTDIVDLQALTAAVRDEAETLTAQAGGRLAWRGVDRPVEVEGDAGRLRQLILILVDNALKYGGTSPAVRFDCAAEDSGVLIRVRDHGPGVAPSDLPHVFERLYRADSSVEAEPGGSGLGLPLAKSIVEGHGGSISLANAPGGGAIAAVRLPVHVAEEEELEAVAP